MEFSNSQIELDQLPDFGTVDLTPVARGYLPYSIVSSTLAIVVLAVVALVLPRLPFAPWSPGFGLPVLLLALTVPVALYCWVAARRRGWAAREHDLIYRAGVIVRTTTVLPLARIQHVETVSGPLERAFGIMRLKCFTAGGMTADLTVLGLDRDQARRLRGWLLERIRGRGV